MAIELICKGCGKKLRVGEEHAGKQARCPECGTVMPISLDAAQFSSPLGPTPSPAAPLGPPESIPTATWTGAAASPAAGPTPAASPGVSPAMPHPFATSASGERWFMESEDGRRYGPATKAELDGWVREGRVSPQFKLQREGTTTWQTADSIYPELLPRPTLAGTTNPYAELAPSAGMPNLRLPGQFRNPHRGGLVLGLGIAGILCCGLLGVAAWIMGVNDIKEMKAGVMDPSGMGLTQAGMIIGIISTVILVISVGFGVIGNLVNM